MPNSLRQLSSNGKVCLNSWFSIIYLINASLIRENIIVQYIQIKIILITTT